MKVKEEELVLENSSPNVGTEHQEIISVGQTKWESDLWPLEGPKKWRKKKHRRFEDWLNEACILYEKKAEFRLFCQFLFSFFRSIFPTLISRSRSFPTIPQLLIMFCFMLGSQVDLYFWNRMPVYFASTRGAYESIASTLFTRVKCTCVRT